MFVLGIEFTGYKFKKSTDDLTLHVCKIVNSEASLQIKPEELSSTLITGKLSQKKQKSLRFIVEQLPKNLLVSLTEQVARKHNTNPRKIWAHYRKWANEFGWEFNCEKKF
jgi:hypothetical protein